MRKASLYEKKGESICCLLCPRHCKLQEGEEGICGARRVVEGELYTFNYGVCSALQWDPVEKKPLYHFYPGMPVLSLGTYGCNLTCTFCQNWSISCKKPGQSGSLLQPGEVLQMLRSRDNTCEKPGAAFTYNEPTIWYEYVLDTARLLKENGYPTIMVTNGYISLQALDKLLPFIDAFNIDVKAFSDKFYKRYCGGVRRPVMKAVERTAASSNVEVTCLLIPNLNDSPEEIRQLSEWLAGISPHIPLHISRYFPQYKLNLPPTPVDTLVKAREIAGEKLHHVYLGNVDLPGVSDTFCPRCHIPLIERRSFKPLFTGLTGGRCAGCSMPINIVLP